MNEVDPMAGMSCSSPSHQPRMNDMELRQGQLARVVDRSSIHYGAVVKIIETDGVIYTVDIPSGEKFSVYAADLIPYSVFGIPGETPRCREGRTEEDSCSGCPFHIRNSVRKFKPPFDYLCLGHGTKEEMNADQS